MDNMDKIRELLLKENQTDEEKLLLEKLSREDKDAEEIINIYRKLNSVVSVSSHLSLEEISNYILCKNNLTPEDKNIIKIIPKIEDHLRGCLRCSEEFKSLNEEFHNIEAFTASELKSEKTDRTLYVPVKRKRNIYRYAFLSIIILGMLYGIMFTISKATAPKYFNLASINVKPDFYTTRGRATNDFLKSLNALDEENIKDAIDYLKADIKNNPGDRTIFYSHYILGLTYLDNAESNFIGLFPHYDSSYVDQAIKNFQEAIQKNNSGNYGNITLDAYFYLAKANLMSGNLKDAKKELVVVIKEKGSKMDEAETILNELE